MDVAIYNSASALAALERWQDTVSRNIAGGSATGFRQSTVSFGAQTAAQINPDAADRAPDGAEATLFPLVTSGVSFAHGETQPTRRDLDVAIQGAGFFEVQAPDGTKLYTRNGCFQLRPDRTIVTSDGYEVLGDNGSPLTLAADQGPLSINHDGRLAQGETTLGKLSIKQFTDDHALVQMKGGYFEAPAGVAGTQVAKPEVLQGYLESSNVAPVNSMMDMIVVSRAYEANQRIITAMDQQMQKTLDALG